MREHLRKALPLAVRQELRHMQRLLRDNVRGLHFQPTQRTDLVQTEIQLTQPIVRSNFFENKLKNIQRGCELLSGSCIEANGKWSFWRSLGRPNERNGFHLGRNLVDGELSAQVGGGLCQLSSMIYHLSLLSHLQVLERYPHSIDIYQEHLRFTPLGADSTVVWGTKDLRLINPHDFCVALSFSVIDDQLVGCVHAEKPIHARKVEFRRQAIGLNLNRVETLVDDQLQCKNDYLFRPVG